MKISLRALIIPVSGLICLVWCAPDVTAQGTITVGQTFCTAGIPCVTTYHNDNNRDGVNANETVFTPTSVKSHTFTTVIDHTDGLILCTAALYQSAERQQWKSRKLHFSHQYCFRCY